MHWLAVSVGRTSRLDAGKLAVRAIASHAGCVSCACVASTASLMIARTAIVDNLLLAALCTVTENGHGGQIWGLSLECHCLHSTLDAFVNAVGAPGASTRQRGTDAW